MSNSELRRALDRVAQQFIDGVLKAIQSVPLAAVAAELGGESALRGLSGNARANGKAGRGRPARGASADAARHGESTARGARRRHLVRRAGSEIEGLRDRILAVLRAASGPIGASEIARQIGGGVTSSDLAFPMAQLRKSALVHKDGERTQTVYTLTERGRNADQSGSPRRGSAKGARSTKARKKK